MHARPSRDDRDASSRSTRIPTTKPSPWAARSRLAADAGHRVVLVFATRGDLGEVDDGVLEPDEALGRAARAGSARRGRRSSAPRAWSSSRYHDSGMAGESDQRRRRRRSAAADVEEAASPSPTILARGARRRAHRLRRARRLRPPRPHPGARRRSPRRRARADATRLRGDHRAGSTSSSLRRSAQPTWCPPDIDAPDPDELDLGVAEARITTTVDVTARSTASGRRWPRTRRRSATSRSSSRSPTDAFRRGVRHRVVHPPRPDARRARAWILDERPLSVCRRAGSDSGAAVRRHRRSSRR